MDLTCMMYSDKEWQPLVTCRRRRPRFSSLYSSLSESESAFSLTLCSLNCYSSEMNKSNTHFHPFVQFVGQFWLFLLESSVSVYNVAAPYLLQFSLLQGSDSPYSGSWVTKEKEIKSANKTCTVATIAQIFLYFFFFTKLLISFVIKEAKWHFFKLKVIKFKCVRMKRRSLARLNQRNSALLSDVFLLLFACVLF